MNNQSQELKRLIKFGVVGAIGAVVHFSILNLGILMLSHALTLPVKSAAQLTNPFAFVCAVTSNFLWNRFWTFPESQKHHIRKQFFIYAAINTIGLGINQCVFTVMTNWVASGITANPLLAANVSLYCGITAYSHLGPSIGTVMGGKSTNCATNETCT